MSSGCHVIHNSLKFHLVLDKGLFCRFFCSLYRTECSTNAEIVMYADDILLIASSVCKLQHMLNRCEIELEWLDLNINASKSHCIRIGNRCSVRCANITTRSGLALDWIQEIHYLGTYIKNSRHFKCSFN